MEVVTDLSVSLGDGKVIGNLDTKSPFVTIQVDSGRINSTFNAIIEAMLQVRVAVSHVSEGVESNKREIADVRQTIADLRTKWENDPRITALNEKARANSERLSTIEEQLALITSKLERHESRLSAQESKKIDLTPLETAINVLKGDVRSVTEKTGEISKEIRGHALKIQNAVDKIAEAQNESAQIAADVKALYDIFEMNDAVVKSLVRDPINERRGKPVKALTDYVLTLPSFQSLRGDFETVTAQLEDSLSNQLYELKRKIADDLAVMKGKIADKLDFLVFEGFRNETEAALRRLEALAAKIDKLTDIVDTKASHAQTQKQYDHLSATKADKGEIVGFLAREDLEPLERDLKSLAQALDALGGRVHLDERKAARIATPPPAHDSCEPDKLMGARIAALEEATHTLEDNKVGTQQLADVYVYVDNGLANLEARLSQVPEARYGITPTEESRPTSAPRRYGQLKALTRPPSAGDARPTIPEQVASPTPPIAYTSSPAKLIPSLAKWRATATLYDVDGHRTNASVTAAHSVPFEEHVENVRRSVAGEEIIPPEFVTHIMK